LVLRRSPDKDFAPGMWECITGRVDQGEGFIQALHREVGEELGVSVEIDFLIGTFRFYRGAPTTENEMLGLHFCCSCDGAQELSLSWEHSEFQWVDAREVDELLPDGHWLRPVIQRADALRRLTPPDLVDFRRETGFGL
jgi:8-oxo-dGTP diphosphatase